MCDGLSRPDQHTRSFRLWPSRSCSTAQRGRRSHICPPFCCTLPSTADPNYRFWDLFWRNLKISHQIRLIIGYDMSGEINFMRAIFLFQWIKNSGSMAGESYSKRDFRGRHRCGTESKAVCPSTDCLLHPTRNQFWISRPRAPFLAVSTVIIFNETYSFLAFWSRPGSQSWPLDNNACRFLQINQHSSMYLFCQPQSVGIFFNIPSKVGVNLTLAT